MDLSGTRLCRVRELCPWESLRDMNTKKIVSLDLRDTIKGHDTIFVSLIVSLSRVPSSSSSSSSIEGNPQLGLDYPVEDPPPVCTWHRKEQSIVFFSYRHRSLPT